MKSRSNKNTIPSWEKTPQVEKETASLKKKKKKKSFKDTPTNFLEMRHVSTSGNKSHANNMRGRHEA